MRSNREREQDPIRSQRLNADVVAGGAIFAFAIFFLVATFAIPQSSFSNAVVGPRAMPLVIGVGLAISASALIVRGLRGDSEDRRVGEEEIPPQNPVKFAVIVGMLLVYVLLFLPLGYVISTFLFLLGVTMYLERERPVRNVVYAIVFSVVVYAVFTGLLGVALPPSPLGI